MTIQFAGVAAIAAVILAAAQAATADVIYDNTTTGTGSRSFTQLQIGDEVDAAGSARLVTELHIGITMQGQAGSADLQARLYANDGRGGSPGSLLWEGPILDNVSLTGGDDLIRFDVPRVEVPGAFTWTVQISDARPVAAGLPHYHPPGVGSSPDRAWFGNGQTWTELNDPNGRPINFMSRVIALSPSQITLAVSAQCPGGGGIIVEWGGASPNGQVALLFARSAGNFVIPNNRPCAGTVLGLSSNQLQIAFTGNAGQGGSRMIQGNIGPGACGGFLQLLDLTTCGTSNTAEIR